MSMTPGAVTVSTGRNRSCAEVRTRSSVSWLGRPGRATTMFSWPWLVISASATPDASTRWRITEIAWSMSSDVTWEPSVVRGVRMSCVPPSRSSASCGVAVASEKRVPARMVPMSAMTSTTSVTSGRRGLGRGRRVDDTGTFFRGWGTWGLRGPRVGGRGRGAGG